MLMEKDVGDGVEDVVGGDAVVGDIVRWRRCQVAEDAMLSYGGEVAGVAAMRERCRMQIRMDRDDGGGLQQGVKE
ncbi:hypothetical protein L2E82_36989 [Cichorium intybus]|uniref:Uncharacterized protein n=1 Tax=Cichorium intybus TaxID=13427 RepID=A0ACB9AED5_CICIN|nr:hypothetical protein L2E82_36989 [Cichorium intybus]